MTAIGDNSAHSMLVTGKFEAAQPIWLGTAQFANWIDSKDNPREKDLKTWMVTVFDDDLGPFLGTCQACGGVTVEEIVILGGKETYALRLGEEGTGWGK